MCTASRASTVDASRKKTAVYRFLAMDARFHDGYNSWSTFAGHRLYMASFSRLFA